MEVALFTLIKNFFPSPLSLSLSCYNDPLSAVYELFCLWMQRSGEIKSYKFKLMEGNRINALSIWHLP